MKPITTFRTGAVLTSKCLCLSGAMDNMDDYAPYSRVISYDEDDEHLWSFHEEDHIVIAVCAWQDPIEHFKIFITMSSEGDIVFMDIDPIVEKIPGAGVYSPDAKGWGYMRTLRQVGDHLYAVGGAGQVYKRLGPNQWVHMDDGVLQAPDVEDRLLLADINGTAEDDIYICGGIPGAYGLEGRLYHWNGTQWSGLTLPTTERLTAVYVADNKNIWISGTNGTLLVGNRIDGFKDLSTVDDNQLFYSLTKFNDTIYLASNLGLFFYEGKTIQPVKTGLYPELQDANVVDVADGVLWSIGPKDIARFDGTKWERIHHPDNPPIGGTAPNHSTTPP